jgi:hypothetical protein
MRVKYLRRMGQNQAKAVVDVPASEAEWLIAGGYAVALEEPKQAPVVSPDMTLNELKDRAEELGIPAYGTKAALATRISEAEQGQ